MSKPITLIILAFWFLNIQGQCYTKNTAYQVGEKLEFVAYYNWHMVWVESGQIIISVGVQNYNNRPVYHFMAIGNTFKKYEWLYKVNDHIESYVDSVTLRSEWYNLNNVEGGDKAHESYIFDHKQKKIYTYVDNTKIKNRHDTITLMPCSGDLLGAIFYCRNIDFNKLKPGDRVPVTVPIEGKINNLFIRYKGKETVTTRDKHSYNCNKFSVMLVEGTIFKGGEDMFVWVSDDANRVPILVEAKILFGSVKGFLKSAENLRYPLSAEFVKTKKGK